VGGGFRDRLPVEHDRMQAENKTSPEGDEFGLIRNQEAGF